MVDVLLLALFVFLVVFGAGLVGFGTYRKLTMARLLGPTRP